MYKQEKVTSHTNATCFVVEKSIRYVGYVGFLNTKIKNKKKMTKMRLPRTTRY